MGSKASINISAGNYIKIEVHTKVYLREYPYRVVLKCKSFERWMQRNGLNYYDVAYYLGLKKRLLIRKVRTGKSFEESQIRALALLMGARSMFFAIYFPSKKERKRVFRETFGYELYNEKGRGRRQRIIWAK